MSTILVIEDEEIVRHSFIRVLESDGHTVHAVANIDHAREVIHQMPPDLIVCDVGLGDDCGLDMVKWIRNHPRFNAVPVIMVTGAHAILHRDLMESGADDFLLKPISDKSLLKAVHARLRRKELNEAAVLETELRLLRLLESGTEIIGLIEVQNHQISYVNRVAESLLGKKLLNILGTAASEHFHIHSEGGLSAALQTTQEQGEWDGPAWLLDAEATPTRPVWLQLRAHQDPAGNLEFFSLSARDTSVERRQEQELELLHRAIRQAPVAIVITDLQGRIEYVNPHFEHVTGYTLEEAKGNNPRILKSGETPEGEYKELWETISKGQEWKGVFHNVCKDGRRIWEQAVISPVIDETGKPTHYVAVKEDITVRKEAEDALKWEQHLMRMLMDSIPAHIYFKDREGRFLRINRAQAELFGLRDPSLAVGRTDFDFFTTEHAMPARQDEEEIMRTGKPLVNRIEKETWPDRPNTWVATSKMPLKDRSGNIIGTFGLSTDITNQKVMEEERLGLQMQLHQAQKLESIGRLAAGIAHEINTPTQYVGDNLSFLDKATNDLIALMRTHQQMVSLLKERGLLDDAFEKLLQPVRKVRFAFLEEELPVAIHDALEGLSRVSKIVRAMKNFSHPGKEELSPTDLNQAIESTLIVSRNEWKYVADLETDLEETLPPVPCLVGEFNQVILNLVVNAAHAIADAIKENPGTKGLIRVSTKRLNDCVEIRIQDSGTGIPASAQAHIFEPFFTTKEVGKGTGQGLALARSVIVERHHGHISFETESGKGTTFVLRLPLKTEEKGANS